MPKLTLSGLWRNADFTKLWTGKTTPAFGSIVTRSALDLAAVITAEYPEIDRQAL